MTNDSLQVRRCAEVATPHARRYLQQLCKHFRHKRPVIFHERSGQVEFPVGSCQLDADESVLRLSLSAPDHVRMMELQDVIGRHLLRFAFREEMSILWCEADRAGSGVRPS